MVKDAVVKTMLSNKQCPKEHCSSPRPLKTMVFSRRSQTTEETEHVTIRVSHVCSCGAVRDTDPVQQFHKVLQFHNVFHFRHVTFSSHLKSKVGHILTKTEALRFMMNVDGAPIVSRSHTHPSHTQNSRLLTSSLSLGVPGPRATQCM